MSKMLGFNYNSSAATDSVDFPLLQSWGVTSVRMLIVQYDDEIGKSLWRKKSLLARKYFKTVEYGLGPGNATITNSNWNDYAVNVVNEAQYCQNNAVCNVFSVGNELRSHIDGSITNLRDRIRELAVMVQPVFTLGPIVYSEDNAYPDGIPGWIQDGNKGEIDLLGNNLYGAWNNRTLFQNQLTDMIRSFGLDNCYVSEWNIDGSWNNIVTNLTPTQQKTEISRRRVILHDSGIKTYHFYNYLSADNSFGVKNTDGTFKEYWKSLINCYCR